MGSRLEKIYPYVPVWVQNVGITLYGVSYRRERLGGRFAEYTAGFRAREKWMPEKMRGHLEAELRLMLLHAFRQTDYYHRKWAGAGLGEDELGRFTLNDLTLLPITTKQDLKGASESFVARDVALQHRLHRYHSSGSTGTPVTIACTADGHRRFIAAREARSFKWAGTSIRYPRAMIGGRMVVPRAISKPPFYRHNAAERQVYFSAYHLAPSNIADYVKGFNRYKPRVLTGYAYSYYVLARMMLEQGLTLDYRPDALVLSSEKLTGEMKDVIAQAFGARAFEEYGAVENCVLATECEEGSLHISPDFGIIEIVDSTGMPVQAGQEGRMLCTGLQNSAQPLIRYEIGDLGIWAEDECPCGRPSLPVLQELVGRLEDTVVGPDGRELVRFHGIFVELPHVLEGQVIQEKLDLFRVKVVAAPGFGDLDEKLIRQRIAARLGHVEVKVERVEELPRTERGKFRAVISHLTAEKKETPHVRLD